MSSAVSEISNRLLPPKVSREPELSADQKRGKIPTLNQIEGRSSLRSSSERSDVSRSVVYLPSQRHLHDPGNSPSTRHSHDGVISRSDSSRHHSLSVSQSHYSQEVSYYQRQQRQQHHQQQQRHQQQLHQSTRRHESVPPERRLRNSDSNQSSDSPFRYAHSSIESVNGSLLSLSLSSIGSFSHRHHSPHTSTDLSSRDRHPMMSPPRTSKYSSSSTVSSLSPQSPETYRSNTSTQQQQVTPVLWTQRLSRRSLKSALPSSPTHAAPPVKATLSFCYCSPQGDVLAISSCGDVVYCTYLPDCHGKLKPCRLCVRSSRPLVLSLGKVNHEMCQAIKSLTAIYGPDAVAAECANECLLQQEGIYSSNSSLRDQPATMAIFADILWIKEYRVHQLEGRLKKVYYRVHEMIQMAQKKIPKLILYLIDSKRPSAPGTIAGAEKDRSTSSRAPQGATTGSVACKCMLMSNLPFPDFYVRWSDGMKLHYSLSDGRLLVNTAAVSRQSNGESKSPKPSSGEMYRWDQEGMADGSDWTVSAPDEIKVYLLQAQKAMKRCLLEEGQWGRSSNSTEPNVLVEKIENLQ
jgi:hypothetical protein